MNRLETRIEELHDELLKTPEEAREEVLDHLEQAVLSLEASGQQAPQWAKAYIAARVDAAVEAQFDNLPL